MIEINNVIKTYYLGKTKVEALKGVSLDIEKGDIACIMGPSGSGKSTLLNILGCLDKPDSGIVTIDGEQINNLGKNQLAGIRSHKIGFIFQSFNLIPVFDVFENIEFPLFVQKSTLPSGERRSWIDHLIEIVGLSEYKKHKPDELSGGQRQRVAIARALVTKPKIILADEPTANLDSKTGETILEIMKQLNNREKVTFLFATHDQRITSYANKCYRLSDGKIDNNP